MSSPLIRPNSKALPINRMIIIFGAVGILALIGMGAKQLISAVAIKSIPVVGEWRAAGKSWRIVFRPDKTIVSFVGPSQPRAPDASPSGSGVYSVDYFGTLWIKLNDGATYTATLSLETPDRFDLVDSSSEGVTVFQRTPPGPEGPDSSAKSRN